MTGELAQIINLITHYNSGIFDEDLYNNNSQYQSCDTLRFVRFKKKLFGGFKEVEFLSTTTEWFEYLRKSNCLKLNLVFQSDNSQAPDHKLAGMVGGGGSWFIEAVHNYYSSYWQPRWEVKNNINDDDKRIWIITYGLVIPRTNRFEHPTYYIQDQKNKLALILTKISDFASTKINEDDWAKIFNEAIESLTDESPDLGYLKDLTPENALPIENIQLLIAGIRSSVFGGMGSWNDMRFDNDKMQEEYDNLSAELYETMCDSIVVAVNNYSRNT